MPCHKGLQKILLVFYHKGVLGGYGHALLRIGVARGHKPSSLFVKDNAHPTGTYYLEARMVAKVRHLYAKVKKAL
jgi:hypothetical protein